MSYYINTTRRGERHYTQVPREACFVGPDAQRFAPRGGAHFQPAGRAAATSPGRDADADLRAEFAQRADLQAEFVCAEDYVFAVRHGADPGAASDLRRFVRR